MQTIATLTDELRLYSSGVHESADWLFKAILPRLRQIAARTLANSHFARTSEALDLVNETWLTRLHRGGWQIESREHFFALASKAMEQVLTDMARRRMAQRRGAGALHLCLEDVPLSGHPGTTDAEQILAIAMLLEQLEKADPETALVVRAHYLMAFEFEEIASEIGLTPRQVRHRWNKGKLWLAVRLTPHHDELKKCPPSRGGSACRN